MEFETNSSAFACPSEKASDKSLVSHFSQGDSQASGSSPNQLCRSSCIPCSALAPKSRLTSDISPMCPISTPGIILTVSITLLSPDSAIFTPAMIPLITLDTNPPIVDRIDSATFKTRVPIATKASLIAYVPLCHKLTILVTKSINAFTI